MRQEQVMNNYFDWLSTIVCDGNHSKSESYRELLVYLHDTEFIYTIRNDVNRAEDGVELRNRFAEEYCVDDAQLYLTGPCSVLEMLAALSIRCEEHIMDDPDIGNRTGQWFWGMIENLGLIKMKNSMFDKKTVNDRLMKLLDHDYGRNGEGGLFRVKNCPFDLRKAEIWYQMCWYLDEIL